MEALVRVEKDKGRKGTWYTYTEG